MLRPVLKGEPRERDVRWNDASSEWLDSMPEQAAVSHMMLR